MAATLGLYSCSGGFVITGGIEPIGEISGPLESRAGYDHRFCSASIRTEASAGFLSRHCHPMPGWLEGRSNVSIQAVEGQQCRAAQAADGSGEMEQLSQRADWANVQSHGLGTGNSALATQIWPML
jgi:hypothetical protein